MSCADPFQKSLSNSFKGMFTKREDEALKRILDSKDLFANEPLQEDSHEREFNERRRKVFRSWPRDPNGRPIRVSSEGKFAPTTTPLWGATLYDFFFVNRVPKCEGVVTISTGSKLSGWMRDMEERAYAMDELTWAACEPNPEVRHASDIGDIIESRDLMIMLRACGRSLRDDELTRDVKMMDQGEEMDAEEAVNKSDHAEDKKMDVEDKTTDKKDEAMVVEGGASDEKGEGFVQAEEATAYIPPEPFDYAKYPSPWPLVPFSSNSPTLESPIPHHLLPDKLIVHDPFGLLHATDPLRTRGRHVDPDASSDDAGSDDASPDDDTNSDSKWEANPHITHTYRLHLSSFAKESIAQERAKIAEAAAHANPIVLLTLYFYKPDGPVRAAVEVTVPPPPPPPCTPEAHLYMSPAEIIGRGNHSSVYRAEWDLPRSVLFKPTICETCVKEAARAIIRKQRSEGDASVSDPSDTGKFVKRTKHFPSLSINFAKADEACDLMTSWYSAPDRIHTLEPEQNITYMAYEGPKTRIHVDSVPWYIVGVDPEPCKHRVPAGGPLPGFAPPTAQVSVAAKISKPGDLHLAREAVNYQRFGPHMSEHWTGYTVARPFHDPTPVGAIVPNFYGYYMKDVEKEDEVVTPDDCTPRTPRELYFSPILLLEDCGSPIEPSQLSLDDRQECGALLLRFHHLGWTQGSFAPRNILMRRGDHADFPLMRDLQEKRFRLIDFGRARCSEDTKNAKEWDAWDFERFGEKSMIWQALDLPFHT